ncbi:ph domain-containing protein [Ophiostoma piceae UAMH 11346]|uniref:Ph domain-containing protein n=1 Tax=Ophiostoma piceae (strain UAMH 11346) TaxID=1262450 RepID=S3CTJ9_OPHP1|nr:ph domain-containing protein [Ophiostoma piceae UAMH 11346]
MATPHITMISMAENATPVDMDTLSPIMSNASSYYRTGREAERLHPVATTSSRRSSASSAPSALRPSLTRRTSLEEDYFYREVFTVERKPNEPPPSYDTTIKKIRRKEREAAAAVERKNADMERIRKTAAAVTALSKGKSSKSKGKGKNKGKDKGKEKEPVGSQVTEIRSDEPEDVLPPYSCDIHIEGMFQKKMEIENTTKRAEDRRWNTAYIVLHGTALEVYECRKDRSWAGRTAKSGPGVSPDRPPWMRKAALEKSYGLSYADVGIAADYIKRRYVIRIRAETDQFLISCVELETFVQWLDALFAAISVAAPIDERDFPRDQSIPRVQRVRWYNGRDLEAEAIVDQEREEDRARESERDSERESENEDEAADEVTPLPTALPTSRPESPTGVRSKPMRTGQSLAAAAAAVLGEENSIASEPRLARTDSMSSEASTSSATSTSPSESSELTVAGPSTAAPLHHVSAQQRAAARAMQSPQSTPSIISGSSLGARRGARFSLRTITSRLAQRHRLKAVAFKNSKDNDDGSEDDTGIAGPSHGPAPAVAGIGARSGFSATNSNFIDAATGKWQPSHRWTKTHDMVYAKLCYATLLFRSPRKSNYIIVRGKQWLVDWKTGNMARVSPPWYGEVECQPGPWQLLHTENMRL